MKINSKIFSLPPYLSTTWNNIMTLHMKEGSLVIALVDGDIIEIPGLSEAVIDLIFSSHAAFLENDKANEGHFSLSRGQPSAMMEGNLAFPMRFGLAGMDSFGGVIQHNPAQANAPDLPKEVLQKISAIARIVAPEDPNELPKAEPHCNCMHCQIARAIENAPDEGEIQIKEQKAPAIQDDELEFQPWTISHVGDQLYHVTNTLDENEKYSVYLGDPLGCTCGQPGCPHILAVLKS